MAGLAALALAASCGGSPEEEPRPPTLTAAHVARTFAAETGRTLRRAPVSDPAWEQLGLGLAAPAGLVRRFGVFSVYVVEKRHGAALASLLSNKASGTPLEPDERGIYWERDSQSGTWIAYSRYGGNVVLAWHSERHERAVDGRWRRLDAVLRRAAVG